MSVGRLDPCQFQKWDMPSHFLDTSDALPLLCCSQPLRYWTMSPWIVYFVLVPILLLLYKENSQNLLPTGPLFRLNTPQMVCRSRSRPHWESSQRSLDLLMFRGWWPQGMGGEQVVEGSRPTFPKASMPLLKIVAIFFSQSYQNGH